MSPEAELWRSLFCSMATIAARQASALELAYEYLEEGDTNRAKKEVRGGMDPLCAGWLDPSTWTARMERIRNGDRRMDSSPGSRLRQEAA